MGERLKVVEVSLENMFREGKRIRAEMAGTQVEVDKVIKRLGQAEKKVEVMWPLPPAPPCVKLARYKTA